MLKPMKERVVLKIRKEEEKTASGFVLAGSAQDKSQFAEVIAISDEEKNLHLGDLVVFDSFSGTPVKDDGEDYLIVKESDILAVVK